MNNFGFKKIVVVLIFIFVFAFNIKVIYNSDQAEIKTVTEINAKTETCYGKWVWYESHNSCRCEPISLGDTWQCTGCWSWSTSC